MGKPPIFRLFSLLLIFTLLFTACAPAAAPAADGGAPAEEAAASDDSAEAAPPPATGGEASAPDDGAVQIPEIEEALYHDWIKDERVVSRFDRKTNSFFLKFKDAESVKEFEKWELDHFAFKKDHFDKTRKKYIEGGGRWGMPDNNICRVVSRYPASTQKLTEKWFSVVSPSITEDGSSTVWHFEAAYEEDYYKQAPIPEDFLKYLSGEIELSDVNLPYDNTRPDRGYPDFNTP